MLIQTLRHPHGYSVFTHTHTHPSSHLTHSHHLPPLYSSIHTTALAPSVTLTPLPPPPPTPAAVVLHLSPFTVSLTSSDYPLPPSLEFRLWT